MIILKHINLALIHLLLFSFLLSPTIFASENAVKSSHFAANYYWDSRDFNTVSLMYRRKNLPHGLSFWGFTDLHSSQNSDDNRSDLSTFFTEARLSKMLMAGLGA